MLLMTGSVLAQILALCISPVMTRIYSEEQIGEYTLIMTAVNMFGAVICGRYDMSIVSEECESKVHSLIKLSVIVTLCSSLMVSIGYTVYLTTTSSLPVKWYITLAVLFALLVISGITNILVSYNNRSKEYKLMSLVSIVREAVRDVLLVVFGLFKMGTAGLLISQIAGNIAGIKKQSQRLLKEKNTITGVSTNSLKNVGLAHIKQPLFSVPAIFANSFSYSVINIFINYLFGNIALGYYSMSYRLLGIPLTIVSNNVSKVFFEKAEKEYSQRGDFRKTFLQTSLILTAIAVPMVIFFMIFAPALFEFFFGDGWGVSGEYVRILAPLFGIRLVVSALTPTMIIVKKQAIEFAVQSSFVVSVIVVFLLCLSSENINYFLTVISIIYSIIYIGYYFLMLCLSKRRFKNG